MSIVLYIIVMAGVTYLVRIFYSTGNMTTAFLGTAVGIILAYCNMPLIVVALASSLTALVSGIWI